MRVSIIPATLPLGSFPPLPYLLLPYPSVRAMPPRQSSSASDQSGRGEQRPTLPPIRQIFGRAYSPTLLFRSVLTFAALNAEELSRSVPPNQTRQSSSPSLTRRQLADEDPRYMSRGGSPAPYAQAPGTPHSFPAYPDMARPGSSHQHPRNASDPAAYPPYAQGMVPHPAMPVQAYPHGYPAQYHPRTPIPTGSYPYAGSQPMSHGGSPMQQQAYPGTEATASDRTTSSRYECTYCGKGFTRPSSLKVRTPGFSRLLLSSPPAHIWSHADIPLRRYT